MDTIRIVIIDDHSLVRFGLMQVLSDEPGLEVCGEATGQKEALQLIRNITPDIAIVDLTLEEGSGIDLIKEMRREHPGTNILVSSRHDESLYAPQVLQAGAMGYVNKRQAIENVVEAVRCVARGEIYLGSEAHKPSEAAASSDEMPLDLQKLTARELEVFDLLAQGLTNREIATRLNRSIKTINAHRENIKTKLGLSGGNDLIRRAVAWWLSR